MRRFALLVLAATITAACGGDSSGDESTSAPTSTATSVPTAVSTPTTQGSDESEPTPIEAATSTPATEAPTATTTPTTVPEEADPGEGDLPDEIERTDHLTLASGVIISSFAGEGAAPSASTAIRAIDGSPNAIGFSRDASAPAVYVFELPANTTFDRFAVPMVADSPGNTTFFGSIEIAGSSTGADTGFEVLVAEDFVDLEAPDDTAEFIPSQEIAVRWIRLTLSGALVVRDEHGVGNTVVRFSELVGNGIQEDQTLSEGFTGIWEFRFADAPDVTGPLMELKQEGATLVGCLGDTIVLTGTVTGVVARLSGLDSNDSPSVYLVTLSPEGELRGVESTNSGVFRSRIGLFAPDGSATPCSDIETELPACGSTIYVNFEVASADIRADSAQILADVFVGLGADDTPVIIVGHTSTEGATDYNQDLSERRAQAVVDNLVARGLGAERIEAAGKGESEPLVSENDEVSRALNRRVEIVCA